MPTDVARQIAEHHTAADRLAAERHAGDAWRPGFDRPPPGLEQRGLGGNSLGKNGQDVMQRPQSAPPEWLANAGPHETPMSIRMANRARFLAEAARQHALKADMPPPPVPGSIAETREGGPTTGGRWGPGERGGWMEHLISDTHASEAFRNSVTPGQLAAMTGKGTGVTFGPDGKFHRVRHHAAGSIGHERSKRGLPANYGGFIPEHVRHDCVGAGKSHKIGSKEHARVLRAASGMLGGRFAKEDARAGAHRQETSSRPTTGHAHQTVSRASDQQRTPRGFVSRMITPRAPRGHRQSEMHV